MRLAQRSPIEQEQAPQAETLPIRNESDIVRVRQAVRQWAEHLNFSLIDQTKVVTASSELARNTVIYGGGGTVMIQVVEKMGRKGVKLVFEDHGPGISDVELAIRDGFTTGSGLGLGLGGARRLANEFSIESRLGEGTRVTITKWKQ